MDEPENKTSCCFLSKADEDICGRPAQCGRPCNRTVSEHSVRIFLGKNAGNASKMLKGVNAYLIETSGRLKLNYRQLCSIESLAFHNPNLTIYVLFTIGIRKSLEEPFEIKDLRILNSKYGNINAGVINLNEFISGSPLEHWYHCTSWREGPYSIGHLSDGIRLLILSKFGGYFFDLDLIHVRPVTHYKNFVGLVDLSHVGNGAMHVEQGHPIIDLAIEEFHKNYRYILSNYVYKWD